MVKDKFVLVVFTSITIAGLLTLAACSTARQQPTVTVTGVSTTSTVPPVSPAHTFTSIPTSYPPMSTLLPVTETRVIRYIPQVPTEEHEGECWRRSTATPYAWRCQAEPNKIFDPCYVADDGTTIVCGTNPATGEHGFRIKLTTPLPSDAWMPADDPWPHGSVVELEDGTMCDMKAGGTSLVFRGKRVNYWCGKWNSEGENVGILGNLQIGTVWAAERIVIGTGDEGWVIVESDVVSVRIVWQ